MKKTGIFKILNTIKNVVCWGLIILLVSTVVLFITARINGETPQIFGYSILRVSSGSMEPELMVGDIIMDRTVDDPSALKEGDVITFKGSGQLSGRLVTHEIIKAPYYEDGVLMLQTCGLANTIADQPISVDDVRGIMVCKVPFLKELYSVFLSPWGLLILIALIILVFIDEIVAIIRILTGNYDPDESQEDVNEIIDRMLKEKALEIAMAEQQTSAEAEGASETDETADNGDTAGNADEQ